MNAFTRFREDSPADLRDQIRGLKKELARTKKEFARRGTGAYDEGVHMRDEIATMVREYLDEALPRVRHGARAMRRSARRHPVSSAATAAIGLVAIGLAVSLFVRR